MRIDEVIQLTNESKGLAPTLVQDIITAVPETEEIWFHGSRATGKQKRTSDTDILVIVPPTIAGDAYFNTVKKLQQLSAQYNNYDIQPSHPTNNIALIAREEGKCLFKKTNEDIDDGYSIAIKPALEKLARACDNWFNMEYTAADIQTILTSPYSKPYKMPPQSAATIYRCIFPNNPAAETERDTRGFISYANSMRGVEAFRKLTGAKDPYYIIAKKIKPADFILNFTSLYEMCMADMGANYDSEGELWIKPTPYYTTHTKAEIVFDGTKPKKKTNEENSKQILSYIKKIHPRGEFNIDQSITDHPEWELTNVPLSKLHIESDDVSPYGQINWIDYDHVDNITQQDIKAKPIVVDANGWIIDGNHRAVAARDMGMTHIPAYVPVEQEDDDKQETYAQHMARVKKEREQQGVQEVINHPGIKTKNQDVSGLVNNGKPVPAGQEQKLLGTKIGRLGAYEVYKWDKGTDSAYSVYDPKTRVSQMTISGRNKAHSFEIFGIYGGPKAPIRAADLYAWLVKNQGLTLVSDKYQSPGGQRVWQELEQRYGRSVNVYAYNMKTNQPINTGADDPESTHGTRGDTAQNVRLVAAPK
jgi:hypothetical protein